MKIILTGYMGSGKTLVGKRLSEKINLPYLDLDEEIERAEKRSVSAIFESSGEIYFRKKESEVLAGLLKSENSFVLSLGGGTPCYGKNLQTIKDNKESRLIYLQTGLKELVDRLLPERNKRPLIAHLNPEELEDFIRKHLFERTFYYNQSDLKISTDSKSVEEIVEEIRESLK